MIDSTRERAKLEETKKLVSSWMREFVPGESLVEGLARKLCERDACRDRVIDQDDRSHLTRMVNRWVTDVADVRLEKYQERLVDRILVSGFHRGEGAKQ